MSDPNDPKIPLLMAKLLMQVGRQEDAHGVLTALPAPASDDPEIAQLRAHLDFIVTASSSPARAEIAARLCQRPEDSDSRYRLAAPLLMDDDYRGAMGQLIEIQRQAPGFRKGAARKGLQALFTMLAPDDPRVTRYRAELFNLTH
jgi:putative thioredoxin